MKIEIEVHEVDSNNLPKEQVLAISHEMNDAMMVGILEMDSESSIIINCAGRRGSELYHVSHYILKEDIIKAIQK